MIVAENQLDSQSEATYPPTVGQRRMLRRYIDRPGEAANHLAVAYHFPFIPDAGRIRDAFAQTFARHSVFGTMFERTSDAWRVTTRSAMPSLIDETVAGQAEAGDPVVKMACASFAAAPFDLTHAPLARGALFRSAGSGTVCFVVHHAIFDAWSQHLFVTDMNRVLAGVAGFSGPQATFANHARRQASQLESGAFAEPLAAIAVPAEDLRIPWDGADCPGSPDNRPAYLQVFINQRTAESVRRQCRALEATVYAAVMEALGHALSSVTGHADPAIVCARHGRSDPTFSSTIGYFVTLAPIRLGGNANASVGNAIRVGAQRLKPVLSTGDVPADLTMLDVDRPGIKPAGSVLLNYRNVLEVGPVIDGVAASAFAVGDSQAEYDLSLLIDDLPDGGIRLAAKYNTSVAGREQISRILSHVKAWLELAATDVELRLSALCS